MVNVKAELDKIEDLKQEIEILKEQVNKSHQSGNVMFFKEAIEGIPEFDDLHTLVVAKKLLTGVAKLWLRSQPTFSTWPDLKEEITHEFDNPIDSRNIHILLTKRKSNNMKATMNIF
ncbi:transposition [Cordylochernes scorpioides]|uniref:Transposition n=1 Tax=Cordylochernes scorpioides TaxID=51811 RepID=A0ABY6LCL6_9ARAC|nr:transposition [Cordylochernes scorpioides]